MSNLILRSLFLILSLAACSLIAVAQNSGSDLQDDDAGSSSRRRNPPLSSPQREIFARAAIEREKAAHAENLERARQTAQLSSSLRDHFTNDASFGEEERKKLERIEKLARRIRSNAGGSDAEGVLENPPSDLKIALERLAEQSDQLRQIVERTPRQVLSAAVIDHTNEILDLARYVRSMSQR